MYRLLWCALAALAAPAVLAMGQGIVPDQPNWMENTAPEVWDFESDSPGLMPGDWAAATSESDGQPPLCVVVDVTDGPDGGRALSIQPDAEAEGVNQAVAMKAIYRNLDVTARMRAESGERAQGGGLIFRWRDPRNYYVCRYDAMTGEFRVSKVVHGREKKLDTADAAEAQWEGLQLAMSGATVLEWDGLVTASAPDSPGDRRWLTLRVRMVGPEITCYLNGERELTAWDDEFLVPGLVGFWTEEDAATTFDDLQVTPLD